MSSIQWALDRIEEAKQKRSKTLDLSYDVDAMAHPTNQPLTSIPHNVFTLEWLDELKLLDNQISKIHNGISQLKNLSKLYLQYNELTILPDCIGQLPNLSQLYLKGNQLTKLPDSIGYLQNLSKLYLQYNQLTTLPDSIGQLYNLSQLDLRVNHLTKLPSSIGQLKNLSQLYLQYNELTTLPNSISQLKNLSILRLSNNPLETPPIEITKGGINKIRDYLRQRQKQGTDYLYEAKLLIVGEGGAGKTTLSKKIEDPQYILQDEDTTKGIEVLNWSFPMPNGHNFHVNIWDFGGQEIYHATHQFFLTKRSLYALVADTRQENTKFYYWLNLVELLSDNSPLLIIKNERQNRQCDINERQLKTLFTNIKETLPTNFEDNRGLDEIIRKICHYISDLPHVGAELPRSWIKVRKALEQEVRNYISQEEYLHICEKNGFTQLKDKLQLSGYLHDLGICLHFQDNKLLKKTIILNPKWGTDAVYRVLDHDQVRDNLGQFTTADLAQIWHEDEYDTMRDELLQLMCRFHLCYQIPGRPNTYIAPQLLSPNQPEYNWDNYNNLILRYTYEFMPKGILTRFIVAMHSLIDQQTMVWKGGVILSRDHTKAEVIEYYGKREIKIRIAGLSRSQLMTSVIYELDNIHRTFNRLKFQKWIPCNCSTCKNQQNPNFYSFEDLHTRIIRQKRTVECKKSYKDVYVSELIDSVMDYSQLDISRPAEDGSLRKSVSISATNSSPEIFISYTWGGDSEIIVNQVDEAFQGRNILIVRDKRDLGFKVNIREFMKRIGQGKAIIVIISDKYLKSDNCMFELTQIAKNGDLYDRIFPIVLADANIYEPIQQINYIIYWEQKIEELNVAMNTLRDVSNLKGPRDALDRYTDYRAMIGDLLDILKRMNTLTPEIHQNSNFETLFQAVIQKVEESR